MADDTSNATQTALGTALSVPAAIDSNIQWSRSLALEKALNESKPLSENQLKQLIGKEVVEAITNDAPITRKITNITEARAFDQRRHSIIQFNSASKIKGPSFKKVYGKDALIIAGGVFLIYNSFGMVGGEPIMGDLDPVDAIVDK